MARAMVHRGPDDEGIWLDGEVGLAFRRLAIIDLDPRSSQPLHHDGLHLAFNGEIYNYRELRDDLARLGHVFTTEGDGEVLLHAWREWGEAALDRLNGMFALAVWDERERSMTMARDLFGEKPLYYVESDGRLAFASDVRALIAGGAHDGRIDEDALAAFTARNRMPNPDRSFFAGVRRLPAAHLLTWSGGYVRVRRYWTPAHVEVPTTYREAVTTLRALLKDSIALRLRSDVPVGTSLSGGIDSSAVVGLCAELGSEAQRHAFTATFPGYERDEWSYAELVARAARVESHHSVRPTSDGLFADLDALVADEEEPFGSASIYAQWRINQAAREAGIVVLLDGQGADELFGGYPWMVGVAAVSRGLRSVTRELSAGGTRRSQTARAVASLALPPRLIAMHGRRPLSPYVSSEAGARASRFVTAAPPDPRQPPMRRELELEAFVTSLPALLRYADRSSMAHSREVRLPFLDRRVAEFALSAPPSFLCHAGVTKRILRDAVRGLVPDPVLARHDKVAFEPPQARWLAEPRWRERIGQVLLDPATRSSGLYDAAAIEADLHGTSWRDHASIWRAFSAESWRSGIQSHAAVRPARQPT